jgi:hypothetical protein
MKMTGKLATLDGGATQVISTSEVNVVGILAQMGGRVITEVSSIMFEKFSSNLEAQLKDIEPAPADGAERKPEPIKAGSLAWQSGLLMLAKAVGNALGKLRRLFRRGEA